MELKANLSLFSAKLAMRDYSPILVAENWTLAANKNFNFHRSCFVIRVQLTVKYENGITNGWENWQTREEVKFLIAAESLPKHYARNLHSPCFPVLILGFLSKIFSASFSPPPELDSRALGYSRIMLVCFAKGKLGSRGNWRRGKFFCPRNN